MLTIYESNLKQHVLTGSRTKTETVLFNEQAMRFPFGSTEKLKMI